MKDFIKSFLPAYFYPGTKKLRPSKWFALGFMFILFLVPIHYAATDVSWVIKLFITTNTFALFAISWDILSGYTGQENFGHHFFIGVGGYLVGLFTVALVKGITISGKVLPAIISFKLPGFVLIILGGLLAAVFGVLIGIPCLKLKGPYLALATLSMGFIFHEFVAKILPTLSPVVKEYTTEGIHNLPKLTGSLTWYYYIILIVLLVSLFLIYSYSRSHYGLVLKAIKDDEPAAKAMGINTTFYKVSIFAGSAFFAGIGGAFFAFTQQSIAPEFIETNLLLKIISICIVGGMGTISGSFGGAYFLMFLIWGMNEIVRVISDITGVRAIIDGYKLFEDIFYYAAIILVMLFMPRGIITTVIKKINNKYGDKFKPKKLKKDEAK